MLWIDVCRIFFAWYSPHSSDARAWFSTAAVCARCDNTVTSATSTASTEMENETATMLFSRAPSCCSTNS